MSEVRVFGNDAMRMVELPLSEVVIREGWSARDGLTDEEVERAAKRFALQPMLHPPTVAQREGEWVLVAGLLRFRVLRHLGHERCVFRWVEGTELELLLLAFIENVARRRLRPHEFVGGVAMLRARGISAREIAAQCEYSPRYIRQLAAVRRDAHPELWVLFTEGRPHLGVTAMLDLVAHPPEEQLERWLEAEKHWKRGDTSARGFSEEEGEEMQMAAGATPRRRFPKRREVKKLLAAVMSEESGEPDYRKGVVDALRWMLFDVEIGTRFSWTTLRGLSRKGAEVIPIRPGVLEAASDDATDAAADDVEEAGDGGEP